jgi:hypothetical protein
MCTSAFFFSFLETVQQRCYFALHVSLMHVFCHRRVVRTQPGTYWMDNFSKTMATGIGSVAKGVWSDCLWAGKAYKLYTGKRKVTMEVITYNDQIVPAMPDDFGEQVWALKKLVKTLEEEPMDYLADSMVKKYNVTAIPLKPNVTKQEDPKFHAFLQKSKDGMADFYPDDIIKHNIGSNDGLLKILRMEYDAKKMKNDDLKRYTVLLCDINIFQRVLKVIGLGVACSSDLVITCLLACHFVVAPSQMVSC